MHCCLLWIVYRPVVIELSKRGPSLICALVRVLSLSVYLYNISGGIFRKQKFHGKHWKRALITNVIHSDISA